MYFEEVVSWTGTKREAVLHSKKKWEQILEFVRAKKFPDDFSRNDIRYYTCACCSVWFGREGCPMESPCNGRCCDEWKYFNSALYDIFHPSVRIDWKILEANVLAILKKFDKWLSHDKSWFRRIIG